MRRGVTLLFLVGLSLSSLAQNTRLSNPYQTVRTHLYFLQDETYNDTLAALPFQDNTSSFKEAISSAVKLKQILDAEGEYIDITEVPRNPYYYDSLAQKHIYQLAARFPDIVVEKQGDNWVYPLSSIQAVKQRYPEVFRFGTDKLIDILPRAGGRKTFGLYTFQYIGILILAFLSFLIHKVFTFFFGRLLLRVLKNAGYGEFATKVLIPVAQPLSLFVISFLLSIFVPVLLLPPQLTRYVILIIKALLPLFGTITFYRLVNIISIYLVRVANKTKSTLDDQLVPLLRKTLKTFVVLIGTLFILDNLNINIIPLLTGLSIGGLAFALAAQDTIKNFFGSLMIFIDKPFQIGDWITTGEIDGNVEEVGFRSSRVRTFRNSVMYVPNGKLADSVIDNHGLRKYRRFFTQISVQYDTPPQLIEVFVQGLRKVVDVHPDTRKDYYNIYLNEMEASSLNIMFYIFFEVPDWPAELKARHEILLEVAKLADHLGVNFAFPTQTLHIENMPGKPSLSASYPDFQTASEKMEGFFKKEEN